MSLDTKRLKLGIMPLIDAAPLVVAKELGFFAAAGLNVELSRESSWSSIRDKVAVGSLDGAQMLAPVPLTMSLGLSAIQVPMVVGMALNLGGNTITLANSLWDRMMEVDPKSMQKRPMTAKALKAVIEDDKADGKSPMTFACVFPYSTHALEIRYWMAAAGIDPDHDVRLIVVPPSQMISYLSVRKISGYCVGEPWGSLAVSMGLGQVAISSRELFPGRLEKVFAVTEEWADRNIDVHYALIQALLEACKWCDDNRYELARVLAQPHYVNAPLEAIAASLLGESGLSKDLLVFHRWAANFPWRSQAIWYLEQLKRWGRLAPDVDCLRVAEQVYRPNIYRIAALGLGLSVPLMDYKIEGQHKENWILEQASQPIEMGPDRLFDGAIFDPTKVGYEVT